MAALITPTTAAERNRLGNEQRWRPQHAHNEVSSSRQPHRKPHQPRSGERYFGGIVAEVPQSLDALTNL